MRDCVIKTGVSGWTIQAISDDLEWSVLQHRPHVVSINVGMNDCVQHAGGRGAVPAGLPGRAGPHPGAGSGGGGALVLHTPNRVLPADDGRARRCLPLPRRSGRSPPRPGAVLVDHYAYWELFEKSTMYLWMSDPRHPLGIGQRPWPTRFQALDIFDPKSLVVRRTCRKWLGWRLAIIVEHLESPFVR